MKLIPRAKPIRIRISAGGEEHSSLDTFLQQYDIESMLSLYKNGSLSRWLNQIGATAIAGRLNDLKINNFEAITSEEYKKFVSAIYGDNINISDIAYKIACYYRIKENSEQNLRWHNIAYKYGNIDSAFELGLIYSDGLYGVEQSNERAIEYLEMAANANFVGAYFRLGHLLSKVKRYDDAEKWLKLALEHLGSEHPDCRWLNQIGATAIAGRLNDLKINNFEAITSEEYKKFVSAIYGDNISDIAYKIACYYRIKENSEQNLRWHNIACKYGNIDSALELGLIYSDGLYGVEQSNERAIEYLEMAANANFVGAYFRLGRLLSKVERCDDAEKWLKLALEHLGSEHPDYTEALILLGDLYYEKDQNDPKVYKYYYKATIRGSSLAKCKLGLLHKYGKGGVDQDLTQALYWYRSAAKDGYANGQVEVGRYYYENYSYNTAITWLQKAVEQDHIEAKVLYACCLIDSHKSPEKAYNLMLEAAKANDSEAQYFMGSFYERGFWVGKNKNQARVWYKKAAENGSENAKARLECL